MISALKKKGVRVALAFVMPMMTVGCDVIYDGDLRPCRNELRVSFVYDYNMDSRDYFSTSVSSVNVWAFDGTGAAVWHGSSHGDALKEPTFSLAADIPPGEYDFVSWCGLYDNDGYRIDTYTPASKEELMVRLSDKVRSEPASGSPTMRRELPMLFNGLESKVTIEAATTDDIEQNVRISLVEDTKYVKVSLAGNTISSANKYSVFITADNRELSYDNAPSGPVTYGHYAEGAVSEKSVYYKLATSRLMADSDSRLTVMDNSDNRKVMDLPLVENLLKIKDFYSSKMGEQEFLDRENNYDIELTLDDKGEFDIHTLIYINGWAIVPTQQEEQ